MKPIRHLEPVHLSARAMHRIEDGRGLQIAAIGGTVWITQACDPRDIVLTRGQSFILDRNGRTIVYALKDAAIVVGPARPIAAAAFAAPATWEAAA